MTRDECKKILIILDASYPNLKIEDMTSTIDSWFIFLQDYDYKTIEAGLKIFISTSGSSFAPSVSELIAYSRKPKELQETDAATAWVQVRNAIRRGIYYSHEDFEKFPDDVKKVVGSPSQIYTWAQMESKEIDTVIWSNFKKSYDTIQNRRREFSALPNEVKALIQKTMIEGS